MNTDHEIQREDFERIYGTDTAEPGYAQANGLDLHRDHGRQGVFHQACGRHVYLWLGGYCEWCGEPVTRRAKMEKLKFLRERLTEIHAQLLLVSADEGYVAAVQIAARHAGQDVSDAIATLTAAGFAEGQLRGDQKWTS